MHPRTITVILFLVIGISAANRTVSSIERDKRATKKIFYSLLGLLDKFGNNRPQEGSHHSSNQCSPINKCRKGHGDCETDQDCRWGLFCGKNNCKGEFGSHSPQGIPWEGKDDCCTNNRNYCNPADRIPFSRRTCCSSSNPCPFSHGDCDKDSDCQSGLICGDNNCKDFHKGAGNKDDCCTHPEIGGSKIIGGSNIKLGSNIQPCSPSNQCRQGHGDCETDQDCQWGLFCGKNNCRGEFGSHSSQGIPWEGKDDCCTNNRNYCNPADRIPFSRRTCCSPFNPCPFAHGDCDKDSDCQSGLICGDNNCKDFHKGAGNKDDCCTHPENGGSHHTGGSNANHQTGNSKLSGCEANPSFRCCTKHRPCALGGGDCSRDDDCQGGLVCGSNNCRNFHPNADRKMDCCAFKKFK